MSASLVYFRYMRALQSFASSCAIDVCIYILVLVYLALVMHQWSESSVKFNKHNVEETRLLSFKISFTSVFVFWELRHI